jgi:membrane fusion protein, multidrug efflux system
MKETTDKKATHKQPVLIGKITLLVLAVVGAVILVIWLTTLGNISTDDASIQSNHAIVSAKTMGRIKDLIADEGAKVGEGDVLAKLDDSDLRAQEAQLQASLNYTTLSANLSKVNLDRAQNDFDRAKSVYKSGISTSEQYDHASKTLEAATVSYELAKAQIETAKAQLSIVETQIANTNIAAPIRGIIAKKNYNKGEMVQPGQQIFLINDLENVWVIANFEETKIRLIKIDADVDITVDAYPSVNFKGKVAQVSAAIVPPPFSIGESTKTTQKVPVRIIFTKIPDNVNLLPGMSVEVVVKVK